METKILESLIQGTPFHPLFFVLSLGLSFLTLLFSMVLSSRLAGGIDFGTLGWILPRAIPLLLVVAILNFFPLGLILSGPIWFFGLLFLFQLDFPQTRYLTRVNWGLQCVWKVLLTLLAL